MVYAQKVRGPKELPLLGPLYGFFVSFSRASRDSVFVLKGYPEGIASPVAGYSCDADLSGKKILSDLNLKDSLMIATKDSFKSNVNISQIRIYSLAGLFSELMTKKATRGGRFLI